VNSLWHYFLSSSFVSTTWCQVNVACKQSSSRIYLNLCFLFLGLFVISQLVKFYVFFFVIFSIVITVISVFSYECDYYLLLQTFLPLANPVEVKSGDYLVRFLVFSCILMYNIDTSQLGSCVLLPLVGYIEFIAT